MSLPARAPVRKLALIDELLIDIAVRVQLSPTLHRLAVDRYRAIATWLEREDSPLRGRIRRLYPQGSMAIGAAIRTKEDDDLFDIDLIAEIDWLGGTTPDQMLEILFTAIRGQPGSLYYKMTKRQTRCVTVEYAEMHLDITPLRRNAAWPERGGYIPHAKEGRPASEHFRVPANPWGFGNWFSAMTPAEDWFARTILEKSYGRVIRADAEPVPEHEQLYAKAMAVVGLQLIKRNVYLNYGRRPEGTRRPPSVYISHSVATNANATASLVDELIHQVACMRIDLKRAADAGVLIDVRNPTLHEDKLTDRWPATQTAQLMFISDLVALENALRRAKAETDIERLRAILAQLFGENTAVDVVRKFYERAGAETRAGASRFETKSATALSGMSAARAPAAATTPIAKHRFYGED